jgi:uncharacterized membrane protein YraQ (UPF0718 family)
MYYLYVFTALAVFLSLIIDRRKTKKAFKIAFRKFMKILPAFALMLVMVSIVLFLLPETVISHYLGNNNKFIATLLAAAMGSVALIPGFIAFPLAGILLHKGVPYMALSSFTTALMMVGILTFPVERNYFGVRVTVMRNIISFFIALVVALFTGIVFGEVGL